MSHPEVSGRVRLAAMVLMLLCAACSSASPAAAQTLSARVAAAPDGVVRFSYPAREGVCGYEDGIGYRDPRGGRREFTFYGNYTSRNDPRGGQSACAPGPLFVDVSVSAHQPTGVRARVGEAPSGATGTVTDVGRVAPEEAARYLLSLAQALPEGRGGRSETTLLAAVLGEGVDLSADLLRMARTASLPERTREQAVFWVAVLGERPAVRQLQQLTEDTSVDSGVRGQAIFALGQTQEAEDAAFLRALYRRLQSDDLKEKAIFSLSQTQGSEDWLLALARNGSESNRMREKAVFWLGQAAGREVTRQLSGLAADQTQNREVQEQAVFALSQRPREEGIPALLQIARTHRDPEVRKKAMFWLAQSRDPRAVDLFEEILRR
jgi:hypothetical protein